jgi:hypothetical protein
MGAVGGEPQPVRRHMRRGPCVGDPVSVCTWRERGGEAHLSTLSLLDNPLLGLSAVCLGLALLASATPVSLALVDKLDGVVARALVLVAVLLRVAFDRAERAFV